MSDDSKKLSVKMDLEGIAVISPTERVNLEALEEWYDGRRRLDEGEKPRDRMPFWKEKLLAPAVIVVLTVGLSGFGIPKVLDYSERTRRDHETTAALMDEIALQTAEMQGAIDARAEAIDVYWENACKTNAIYGGFGLQRDIGEMSHEEFGRRDALIENDRKRIGERFDTSASQYAAQLQKFRPWLQRTATRITVLYAESESRIAAQNTIGAIGTSVTTCDSWLKQRVDKYDELETGHIHTVKESRALFIAGKITRDEHKDRVSVVLDKLRKPTRLQLQPCTLDNRAVTELMEFVRATTPQN